MRKGAKRAEWTVAEERFLVASAGKMPKREICRRLRRSSASVRCKAASLRRAGIDVDLRFHRTAMVPCQRCGSPSGTVNRTGVCEPCRRRAQLAAIQARIASLLPQLPQEERALYAATEAKLGSGADPLPEPPDTSGLSGPSRAYREEAHALAVEQTVARNLRRQVKAAQKRKERIEKKVKSMRLSQIGAQK